jgi:hypothetical protein
VQNKPSAALRAVASLLCILWRARKISSGCDHHSCLSLSAKRFEELAKIKANPNPTL